MRTFIKPKDETEGKPSTNKPSNAPPEGLDDLRTKCPTRFGFAMLGKHVQPDFLVREEEFDWPLVLWPSVGEDGEDN